MCFEQFGVFDTMLYKKFRFEYRKKMSSMLPQLFPLLQGHNVYVQMFVFSFSFSNMYFWAKQLRQLPSWQHQVQNLSYGIHYGRQRSLQRYCICVYFFDSSGSYLYISVLVHFPVTSLGHFRAFDVNQICSFGELLLC